MTNEEHANYLEVIATVASLLEALAILDFRTPNGQDTIRWRYEEVKQALMAWGIE